jgi:hypothetical protein
LKEFYKTFHPDKYKIKTATSILIRRITNRGKQICTRPEILIKRQTTAPNKH